MYTRTRLTFNPDSSGEEYVRSTQARWHKFVLVISELKKRSLLRINTNNKNVYAGYFSETLFKQTV